VIFDSPNRQQPYAHQLTVGYVRELAPQLAYVHVHRPRVAGEGVAQPRRRAVGAVTRLPERRDRRRAETEVFTAVGTGDEEALARLREEGALSGDDTF